MSTAYRSPPNSFRADLLAGKRLIGCWCSLANASTAEVLGLAGFDWLLIDGEHAPNDVSTLVPQLMALKDSVSAPVVRPPWNEPVIIKRLLDAGFHNFLMPFVDSAAEARAAVAATRYPPRGIRGVSVSQRGNRFGTVPDYLAIASDHIAVMVQIESRGGLEAVRGDCGRGRRGRPLRRSPGPRGRPRAPRQPGASGRSGGDQARLRTRPRGREARRNARAGGSRRAPLHGMGSDFRGRGQRPRALSRGHAGAAREVPHVRKAPPGYGVLQRCLLAWNCRCRPRAAGPGRRDFYRIASLRRQRLAAVIAIAGQRPGRRAPGVPPR